MSINKRIALVWLMVVALAYGCNKIVDVASEWNQSHPDTNHSSSVGYPYHTAQ